MEQVRRVLLASAANQGRLEYYRVYRSLYPATRMRRLAGLADVVEPG
jgi:hypothetical protein